MSTFDQLQERKVKVGIKLAIPMEPSEENFKARNKIQMQAFTDNVPPMFCYKKSFRFLRTKRSCPDENYPLFGGLLKRCYKTCKDSQASKLPKIDKSYVYTFKKGTCYETCYANYPEGYKDVSLAPKSKLSNRNGCHKVGLNFYTDWENHKIAYCVGLKVNPFATQCTHLRNYFTPDHIPSVKVKAECDAKETKSMGMCFPKEPTACNDLGL